MSKGEVKALVIGALIAGVIGYFRHFDAPLATSLIARLIGNMMGGAFLFWVIARLYQKGERRS